MPNGCGTEAHPLPNGFGAANFRPCCNTHDCCYDTCNGNQVSCDNDLLACFKAACATAYPPVSGISGALQKIKYGSCISAAETGYSLVYSVGFVAFNATQRQACDCCGSATCPQSCAGGACGALPPCAGGADCVCFTSVEGNGACIHGATPCSSVQSCSSTADCPTGTVWLQLPVADHPAFVGRCVPMLPPHSTWHLSSSLRLRVVSHLHLAVFERRPGLPSMGKGERLS